MPSQCEVSAFHERTFVIRQSVQWSEGEGWREGQAGDEVGDVEERWNDAEILNEAI